MNQNILQFSISTKKSSGVFRWMCGKLDVTKAAYYKWLHLSTPKAEQKNNQLSELICEYNEQFKHILGYRRMRDWINHFNGTNYSRNRVYRLMKVLGIQSVIRKKKKKYTYSTPETTAENVLKRDFSSSKPNEKWVTDVTEFKWYEGVVVQKLYLSAILDLYDRSIVSYCVSRRNDNKLVFDTFDLAMRKIPDAKPILHSDRGFQYTSKMFQMKLREQQMEQSMSRAGCCVDNGPIEGFGAL